MENFTTFHIAPNSYPKKGFICPKCNYTFSIKDYNIKAISITVDGNNNEMPNIETCIELHVSCPKCHIHMKPIDSDLIKIIELLHAKHYYVSDGTSGEFIDGRGTLPQLEFEKGCCDFNDDLPLGFVLEKKSADDRTVLICPLGTTILTDKERYQQVRLAILAQLLYWANHLPGNNIPYDSYDNYLSKK